MVKVHGSGPGGGELTLERGMGMCRGTLCHLLNIVHLCSSPNPFKPHPRPNLRNLNSFALDPPFCRLTLFQRSFYPYAPTLWNYLPEETVQCKSLSPFKTAVHFHLV